MDVAVQPTEDTQVYAVAAPEIPQANGGGVRLFDGFLHPFAGQDLEADNPVARTLDPAVSSAAAVLRFFLYYPSGVKRSHVLRLVTYREPGSF